MAESFNQTGACPFSHTTNHHTNLAFTSAVGIGALDFLCVLLLVFQDCISLSCLGWLLNSWAQGSGPQVAENTDTNHQSLAFSLLQISSLVYGTKS